MDKPVERVYDLFATDSRFIAAGSAATSAAAFPKAALAAGGWFPMCVTEAEEFYVKASRQ